MRRWMWPLCGVLGLLLFLWLSPLANPEAQVDLQVTRTASLAASRAFLTNQGYDLTGFRTAITFTADDVAVDYVQRTEGLRTSNRLAHTYHLWFWSVRWFKPGDPVEYRVTVDTFNPIVLGFARTNLPDAIPGAVLSQADGQTVAERFLTVRGYTMSQWTLVSAQSQTRLARTDHHFEWQETAVHVGQAVPKVMVEVQGDQPTTWSAYLLVPEGIQREQRTERSLGDLLAAVSTGLMWLLWLVAGAVAIRLAFRQVATWRMGVGSALLVMGLLVAGTINELPLASATFSNALPLWGGYVSAILLGVVVAVGTGAQLLVTATAGQGLLHQLDLEKAPFFSRLGQGALLSPAFGRSALRGVYLAGVMVGFEALFYMIGRQYFGVWSPAGPRYHDMLAAPLPWLYPITVSMTAALTEEFTFRLFGGALLRRLFRWPAISVVVPAIIWAFAHSNYPVFPVWTRGLELTIMGILLGVAFWRYDLETVVIAHFTYDALLVGWPLLKSGHLYYVLLGATVVGLALLPASIGWLLLRRSNQRWAYVPGWRLTLPRRSWPGRDLFGSALDRLGQAIRLRSRIWIWTGMVLLCLAVPLLYSQWPRSTQSNPIAGSVAEQTARAYLTRRGFSVRELRSVRALETEPFAEYAAARVPEQADLVGRQYGGRRWVIRFFRPLDPADYTVDVDARTGRVLAFNRTLARDSFGPSLNASVAEATAEAFLRNQRINPVGLTLTTRALTDRAHRLDYHFVWTATDSRLPGALIERSVVIQGDQIGAFQASQVRLPDAWVHAVERRWLWYTIAGALGVLLGVAALLVATLRLISRQVAWQQASVVALGGALVAILPVGAHFAANALSYQTETLWSAFITLQILGAGTVAGLVGLLLAALWVVGRSDREPIAWRSLVPASLGVVGLALGLFMLFAVQPVGLVLLRTASQAHPLDFLLVALGVIALEAGLRPWLQTMLGRVLQSRLVGMVVLSLGIGLIATLQASTGNRLATGLVAFLADGLLFGLALHVGGRRLSVGARLIWLLMLTALVLV